MTNIRKCPYKNCLHGGSLDIDKEEFVKIGSRYYHTDCFEEKQKQSVKKKCGYSKCKHDGIVNTDSEDCVEDNGKYYHRDCLREKNAIAEIIDFWYREIDEDVVFNQLRKVIDQLVYQRGMDASYILFAIKKKAKFLNYPSGIYYAVGDKRLKADWRILHEAEILKEVKAKSSKSAKMEPVFQCAETKKTQWGSDIFGGV